MDSWSRLIMHTPLSEIFPDSAKDPVIRLRRFEKEYNHLLHAWRNSSNLAEDYLAAEEARMRLHVLNHILSDEIRRRLPRPCIDFAVAHQLHISIAIIAITSHNEWVIKEAVSLFATLVESEEEAFVESEAFAASLTTLLVKITGANSIRLNSDNEARVVELAFNVTTKIRLMPTILPAWFKLQGNRQQPDEKRQEHSRDKFEGRTQREDFPLFYILVDYIHHEGKVGDFARTGLLYMIETASTSVELEQWIVESDLPTLMATGLGALYSQLSGKLVIDYPSQVLPPILALSDYQPPVATLEIVPFSDPGFQAHLDTFLSHLVFWQDVLNHCKSVEVKSTLLEHFQIIFLQQLLYPSLLESSDIDGGSSVAVLTYLRQILEALDHPDMIHLILHYLLGLPDIVAASSEQTLNSVSKARKRKSMDLATMMALKTDDTLDPLLYTLVDLILACLRSPSHQTIHATLRLVSVILKRHHRYAVTTLIRTENVQGDMSDSTTIGAQQQQVEFLMSLAGNIGGQDNFDEVYENVVKDTTSKLESHACSMKLTLSKINANDDTMPPVPDSLPGAPRDVRPHTIRPEDPLLGILLDNIELFFLNPVETNLGITETLFDLAMCGFIRLEGWFLRHPDTYIYDADDGYQPLSAKKEERGGAPDLDFISVLGDEDDAGQVDQVNKCRRRPIWSSDGLPRLLKILQQLSDQVTAYRNTIPRFNDLLQQRRESFQTADSVATAVPRGVQPRPGTPGGVVRSSIHSSRSGSPQLADGLEGFAQRIFRDLNEIRTPSRSSSPRDGKLAGSGGPPPAAGFGMGTPSTGNKGAPVPTKEFPVGHDRPIKSTFATSRAHSPAGQGSRREDDAIRASQLAAFQVVDQQLLARKVGLPLKQRVKPLPLKVGGEMKEDEMDAEDVEAEDGGTATRGPVKDDAPADGHGHSAAAAEEDPQTSIKSVDPKTAPEEEKVSVSHILTNAIILQYFLFELAALVQVRAGLFGTVRFA